MPLSSHDFCFVLSLQAGVVATSTIGFTVMLITFIYNLYAPNSMEPNYQICQYICLYVYLLITMTAFGMAFLASFWELSKFIKIAAIVLSVGAGMFLILTIISYIRQKDIMKFVCPAMRCPDHHWLQDSRWREIYIKFENDKEKESEKIQQVSNDTKMSYQNFRSRVTEKDSQKNNNRQFPQNNLKSSIVKMKDEEKVKNRNEDVLVLVFVSFLYSSVFIVYYAYSIVTWFAYSKQLNEISS